MHHQSLLFVPFTYQNSPLGSTSHSRLLPSLKPKVRPSKPGPRRKRSYSKHPFPGVNSLLVSGRVGHLTLILLGKLQKSAHPKASQLGPPALAAIDARQIRPSLRRVIRPNEAMNWSMDVNGGFVKVGSFTYLGYGNC